MACVHTYVCACARVHQAYVRIEGTRVRTDMYVCMYVFSQTDYTAKNHLQPFLGIAHLEITLRLWSDPGPHTVMIFLASAITERVYFVPLRIGIEEREWIPSGRQVCPIAASVAADAPRLDSRVSVVRASFQPNPLFSPDPTNVEAFKFATPARSRGLVAHAGYGLWPYILMVLYSYGPIYF